MRPRMPAAFLLCLALCLAPAAIRAAQPKAVLIGPSSVQVGQDIVLRFTGTVTDSDAKLKLKLEKGPESIAVPVFYGKDGRPDHALARATKPGSYQFSLLALGTPDGTKDEDYDTATLTVEVVDPNPGPNPNPNPAPNPNPIPNPNPTPNPLPDPGSGFTGLGSRFAPILASSLADGFDAGADALHSGKAILDADKALQMAFYNSRQKAFSVNVAPELAKLLADGEEPKTPAERAQLEAAWRAFSKGLRGARTP
jgi:hypothetical protein